MSSIVVKAPKSKSFEGSVALTGSKSESNRALIIQALAGEKIQLKALSNADDTIRLQQLLANPQPVMDCGPAGTTFRFLTAYLSIQKGTYTLTGSDRMKKRPIAHLVEALRALGADIEYLEEEGFPPLKINGNPNLKGGKVSIRTDVSSQFASALLLISPYLKDGLELTLEGNTLSRTYLEMTIELMQQAGAQIEDNGKTISVKNNPYQPCVLPIEPDWSGLSYWYAVATLSKEFNMTFPGFRESSLQGDKALVEIFEQFGIQSTFSKEGVTLSKAHPSDIYSFTYDFKLCPDIAQTVAACCAALGVKSDLTGLDNLSVKECDRIAVIQSTLSQLGSHISTAPTQIKMLPEQKFDKSTHLTYDTYHDHRVAMSLAPLALVANSVTINDPEVVVKSYPNFWDHFSQVGFSIEA